MGGPPIRRPHGSCCGRRSSTPPGISSSARRGRRSRWPTSPPAPASAVRPSTTSSATATSSASPSSSTRPNGSWTASKRRSASTSTTRARAVLAALEHFLSTAGDDPLIKILLSDDGTGGMLPFVTTQGLPIVQWAASRLTSVIEEGWPEAPEQDVKVLTESLVRLGDQLRHHPGPGRRGRGPQRRRAVRPVHRQGPRLRGRVMLSPRLDSLGVRPLETEDAAELHALIEVNRAHLARWLPWAATQDPRRDRALPRRGRGPVRPRRRLPGEGRARGGDRRRRRLPLDRLDQPQHQPRLLARRQARRAGGR